MTSRCKTTYTSRPASKGESALSSFIQVRLRRERLELESPELLCLGSMRMLNLWDHGLRFRV